MISRTVDVIVDEKIVSCKHYYFFILFIHRGKNPKVLISVYCKNQLKDSGSYSVILISCALKNYIRNLFCINRINEINILLYIYVNRTTFVLKELCERNQSRSQRRWSHCSTDVEDRRKSSQSILRKSIWLDAYKSKEGRLDLIFEF